MTTIKGWYKGQGLLRMQYKLLFFFFFFNDDSDRSKIVRKKIVVPFHCRRRQPSGCYRKPNNVDLSSSGTKALLCARATKDKRHFDNCNIADED